PPFVTLGDEFDYRITVVNHGPSTATDVVVVDTLPAGMTYIRDSVGAINDGSGTLTWELGDMAAGEERVIILTVDTEVGATASIQNTASVSSNELDRTPDNDTDTASTVGVAPPPPPPS